MCFTEHDFTNPCYIFNYLVFWCYYLSVYRLLTFSHQSGTSSGDVGRVSAAAEQHTAEQQQRRRQQRQRTDMPPRADTTHMTYMYNTITVSEKSILDFSR